MTERWGGPSGFETQLIEAMKPDVAPDELRRGLMLAGKAQDSRWKWHSLGLAALLMILLGGGGWGWMYYQGKQETARFAQAVLAHYVEDRHMDFAANEGLPDVAGQYRQWSLKAAGFSTPLPACLEGQSMRGACACTITSCRAVCLHLQDGRAIYIFDQPIKEVAATAKKPYSVLASNHRAEVWNENGRGYVLIAPPGWRQAS